MKIVIMAENNKEHTVLITDDEKINLEILSGILSPTYNLLISRTGSRTLELANEYVPDLILLDVIMPEMSGFEIITKLKESNITYKIPVIFITGLSGIEDEEKGFFLGAVDYITKPFHKSIVKVRVNNHIKIIDQMRMIERIGLIDPLTKIANRRGFDSRISAEWGRALREHTLISLMILDVDRFKNYNDTFGHQQGDEALKAVADTSVKTLKRPSDFIARWGGEEFVILLPNTDTDGAVEVAEKVRKNIEALVLPTGDGVEPRITVSIGVTSIIPDADTSITDVINKADRALYEAKESGRNKVVKSR
jgi:diguanylate cyclase (GGDEF)-like protein